MNPKAPPTLYVEAPLCQLSLHLQSRPWHVITDSHLQACLDWSWCPSPPLVIPAGEASKCLAQAEILYHQLAELDHDRQSWLVAVGGGVVGDLAGFVAATYLRGLDLVQVPTTLMAQVDSSVGGKVGIDLPAGKNLVGSFYPPRLVYLDTKLLDSLPLEQWQAGMAEVLKHGLLQGPRHWQWLEELPEQLSPEKRQQLIINSRKVKLDIVAKDPREQGVRAHLNLGHTFAHALEAAQGYQGWNHGQAVALGLRAALRLSQKLLGLEPTWEQRLLQQLQRYQLPSTRPDLPFSDLVNFLKRDKKNLGQELRLVLLQAPGLPQVHPVSLADLEQCWEELPLGPPSSSDLGGATRLPLGPPS